MPRRNKNLMLVGVIAASLLGIGVIAAVFLVVAHSRGDLPVLGAVTGEPTPAILAENPWWKGRVTKKRVQTILDELHARTRGRQPGEVTVFYNQAGDYWAIETIYEPIGVDFKEIVYWGVVKDKYPAVAALGGDVKRVEIKKRVRVEPSSSDLANALENSLNQRSRDDWVER